MFKRKKLLNLTNLIKNKDKIIIFYHPRKLLIRTYINLIYKSLYNV